MKRRSKHGYIGTARIINHDSGQAANLEHDTSATALPENQDTYFKSPVDIYIRVYSTRRGDTDGRCEKYVIDGLIQARILKNDGPECVRNVTKQREVKVKNEWEEKTTVKCVEVLDDLEGE